MDQSNDSIDLESASSADKSNEDGDRRTFLVKTTVCASAVCAVFPLASGIPAILDPVKEGEGDSEGDVPWSKVTSLAALSEDGIPARFSIFREKVTDAWTTLENVPVGAVYLIRNGGEIKAFNLKCPHLGCAIDYRGKKGDFFCPCHNSSFDLAGAVSDPDSPSPRGMDELETKIEEDFVWVQFRQFRPNLKERVPLA